MALDRRREAIIEMFRSNLAEIEREFSTAAHWNEHIRKPGEAPIDVDPDGKLRAIADAYREALEINKQSGGVGKIVAPSLGMLFPRGPDTIQ